MSGGVPVEAVAGHVVAGDPVDFVAAEYRLDRVHVLLACWYLGLYGHGSWRRRWRVWAQEAHEVLRQDHPDYSAIPDPPDLTQIRQGVT
jgi:hypothetical protein